MFRTRLTIALAVLSAACVLQGTAAVWALGVADLHLQRGRIATDIHLGFVELSVTKQRLRTWLSQSQLDAGAETSERERLQREMAVILDRLNGLSRQARALELDTAEAQRHALRQDALAVLGRSLGQLDASVDAAQPLPPGADAHAAWHALSAVFDLSEGRDLRRLLADNIAREAASVKRERGAADLTLRWMRGLWLATAVTLAVAAMLVAAYFARALRQPLDRLRAGAAALQGGNLAHRIPADRPDEFATVARSFNAMAAELDEHRHREARARHELEGLVQARTAELQGAMETLQQMDVRRRQLFADISHELRTPTTAIRGEAEITLRGSDKPIDDYKNALQRIVATSRELALVIDDLLTMARSDIDALSLERRPIALAGPLDEALAQARALAHDRQVMVLSEPASAVGLSVLADGQRLRQLFMVLLDNAVRYSHPGGTVRTSVRCRPANGGAGHCEVQIADDGIGIEADELPQVFERNFRSAQARRHRADGSGLGLSIGATLARAHGGSIDIQSTPGRGTTLTLKLPLLPLLPP